MITVFNFFGESGRTVSTYETSLRVFNVLVCSLQL